MGGADFPERLMGFEAIDVDEDTKLKKDVLGLGVGLEDIPNGHVGMKFGHKLGG